MLLFVIAAVVAGELCVIAARMRLADSATGKTLWMSAQWLAEYRASHS